VLAALFFSPNVYSNYNLNYSKIFKEVFTKLKKGNTQNLIIDLRGCSGGAISVPMEFLTYLISEPFRCIYESYLNQDIPEEIVPFVKKGSFYMDRNAIKIDNKELFKNTYDVIYKPHRKRFKGNIYFITDGGTLSSSGMFMAIIKSLQIGKIIGEEAAGAALTGNNGVKVKLPNSGVYVDISYKVSNIIIENGKNNGFGVLPDYPVTTTIKDIQLGVDAEINTIKKLIYK
jgi:C-terminal processing protease CtpA/Prc